MGGKGPADSTPDQWYRFIIPIFYHAGLIHLAFNMFMQVTLGGDMEREIGMMRFIIVYFCSGIFGFVLGGNLGAHGQVSV
jgi:membrane associated rhomboid family serine protease